MQRGTKTMAHKTKWTARYLMGKHDNENIYLYDNGGKTYDRYTVVFMNRPTHANPKYTMFECVGFNDDPFSPLGFGQYCSAMPGRHLGKRIKISDLPEKARKFVEQNI